MFTSHLLPQAPNPTSSESRRPSTLMPPPSATPRQQRGGGGAGGGHCSSQMASATTSAHSSFSNCPSQSRGAGPRRMSIRDVVNAVLAMKRFAKSRSRVIDSEIVNIDTSSPKRAEKPENEKMGGGGKAICTFEESPFYVHKACAQGLMTVVEKLIAEDPTRVGLKDKAGLTCLHHAVARNRFVVIDFLLQNGADINAQSPEGNTGLHMAVEKGKADTVRHLLLAKADGNVIDSRKLAPIHLAASLGNKDVVTELCNFADLVDINLKGFRGQLALHFAARGDHVDAAEVLLRSGCRLDLPSENGFYPIHVAAKSGSNRTLKLFLEIEFYPWANSGYTTEQLLNQVDKEKNNGLHMAVNSGNLQTVSICLKSGAAVDVRQEDFSTPLHLACAQGSLAIVQLLYETHVQRVGDEDEARMVLENKDVLDMSLLHRAAMFDHPEVVQYLLHQKADIESTDQERRTPLILAVACSAFRAFRSLLNNEANVSALDRNKRSIMHYLIGRSYVNALAHDEFLKLCQTEEGRKLINQKDIFGCTPLHLAAKEGTVRCVEAFVPLGANMQIKDMDERCALHFAAKFGRYNVVKRLLESPIAMNILSETDGQGMTALHIASMYGHTRVVQLLLYKGALLHKDYMGRSPLHLAAQNDFVKTMDLLLSFHHNLLDQRDRTGNTALHYAVQANRTRPTDLLLRTGCVYSFNDDLETPMDIALQNQHLEVALVMVQHKRWNEILDYRCAEAFMGLIRHLPQICHVVLDRCRTCAFMDSQSRYYWEKYNFHYLQRNDLKMGSAEEGSAEDKMKMEPTQPLEALNLMVAHQRVDLLAHPVCSNYLNMKWRAYGLWIFSAQLVFYSMLVASFTVAIWGLGTVKVKGILEAMRDPTAEDPKTANATAATATLDLEVTSIYYTAHCIAFALILANFLKEVVQIYNQGLLYLAEISNYLEWTLYVAGLIATCNTLFTNVITPLAWQCGAIAVFVSWFNLLIHLQRLDSMGLYVVMFLQILKTMIRVILVFSVLIVAFGLTFYMLLANTDSNAYMSPQISIVRSVMLMMGDFDFVITFVTNLTEGKLRFPELSYLFLLLFVVLVPILFVNLLIGLAVGDIEMVQKDAQLKRLAMQVEYHTDLERKLPRLLLNRVDKLDLVVFPNRFKSKLAFVDSIKSFLSHLFRPQECNNAKPTSGLPTLSTFGHHQIDNPTLRSDPMVLEMARTKKKLQRVQHQLGAVKDLLKLVVRKLDAGGPTDLVESLVGHHHREGSVDEEEDDDDDVEGDLIGHGHSDGAKTGMGGDGDRRVWRSVGSKVSTAVNVVHRLHS